MESVCTKLSQQDVEELRPIKRVLWGSPQKSNLSKAEAQAIRELKGDKDRLILTADKGVAMVVMDRQDYVNKSNNLYLDCLDMSISRHGIISGTTALVNSRWLKWDVAWFFQLFDTALASGSCDANSIINATTAFVWSRYLKWDVKLLFFLSCDAFSVGIGSM